jgi:hypothetical protein
MRRAASSNRPSTAAIAMRRPAASTGSTVSLLQAMVSGVVDQISTTAR